LAALNSFHRVAYLFFLLQHVIITTRFMLTRQTPTSYLSPARFRRLTCLFLALLFVLMAATMSFSAVKVGIKAEPKKKITSEQQYMVAKEYASRLEQDRSLGKDRGNWLNNARTFRNIHVLERKGTLGPLSLYMTAKTYHRMYAVFNMPLDLETALNSYLELADLYPGHTLADDALYSAAECAQQNAGKEKLANDLYLKIVTIYPQGDQYEKAKARINKPEKEKLQSAPLAEPPVSRSKHLNILSPVKYWSSEDYSRIVLQTTTPVSFKANVGEQKSGDKPYRLYVDLERSYVPPKLRTPILVRDGLLKEVHSNQNGDETVRITLELESLAEYKIFSLTDPFRVIVDIHGAAKTTIPPLQPSSAVTSPNIASQSAAEPVQEIVKTPSSKAQVDEVIVSLSDQKKRSPNTEPPTPSRTGSREKLSLAQQLGLGVRKIVIDPGHGGKDPGAMAFGLKEKDIVLKISKKISKILKETYRYEVVLTRTKDVYVPLEERTAIANTHKSDLFISIHINAHSDQTKGGIETYFLNLATDANAMRVAALENATSTHSIGELQDILTTLMKNSKIDESTRLARFVQTNLVSNFGHSYKPRDLGVKQAPFYVLIGAEMPAILAEISFITNPDEAKLLQNEQYLDKIAAQLAAGIAAYVDHHHTAAVKL
jgi:N-acetylmuramoyl-L-alanine amidase